MNAIRNYVITRTMLFFTLVTAALAFSVAFGESASSLGGDDPIVQKINDIISNANNYLTDHLLTTLSLPDLGVLPLDPVKLTEGKVSQFDTIQLSGTPVVEVQKNPDGSETYTFAVDLSLNVLLVQYQLHASFLGLLSEDGQLTISPQKNTLRIEGIVVVGPGSHCDARTSSAKVRHFEDFQMDIEPTDIPFISKISETVLNFVSPKLRWVFSAVLNTAVFSQGFQTNFSDLVCSTINSN